MKRVGVFDYIMKGVGVFDYIPQEGRSIWLYPLMTVVGGWLLGSEDPQNFIYGNTSLYSDNIDKRCQTVLIVNSIAYPCVFPPHKKIYPWSTHLLTLICLHNALVSCLKLVPGFRACLHYTIIHCKYITHFFTLYIHYTCLCVLWFIIMMDFFQ